MKIRLISVLVLGLTGIYCVNGYSQPGYLKARDSITFLERSNAEFSLDVNDSFILKFREIDGNYTFRISVLDGLRQIYGNCGNGKLPGKNDPKSTSVYVKFDKNNNNKSTSNVIITRSLDFSGKLTEYRVDRIKNGDRITLEDGVVLWMYGGYIGYKQSVGQIGPHGRSSLSAIFDVFKSKNLIQGQVGIEDNIWDFLVDRERRSAKINGLFVDAMTHSLQVGSPRIAKPISNIQGIAIEPQAASATTIVDPRQVNLVVRTLPEPFSGTCEPLDCSGDGHAGLTCQSQSPFCNCGWGNMCDWLYGP